MLVCPSTTRTWEKENCLCPLWSKGWCPPPSSAGWTGTCTPCRARSAAAGFPEAPRPHITSQEPLRFQIIRSSINPTLKDWYLRQNQPLSWCSPRSAPPRWGGSCSWSTLISSLHMLWRSSFVLNQLWHQLTSLVSRPPSSSVASGDSERWEPCRGPRPDDKIRQCWWWWWWWWWLWWWPWPETWWQDLDNNVSNKMFNNNVTDFLWTTHSSAPVLFPLCRQQEQGHPTSRGSPGKSSAPSGTRAWARRGGSSASRQWCRPSHAVQGPRLRAGALSSSLPIACKSCSCQIYTLATYTNTQLPTCELLAQQWEERREVVCRRRWRDRRSPSASGQRARPPGWRRTSPSATRLPLVSSWRPSWSPARSCPLPRKVWSRAPPGWAASAAWTRWTGLLGSSVGESWTSRVTTSWERPLLLYDLRSHRASAAVVGRVLGTRRRSSSRTPCSSTLVGLLVPRSPRVTVPALGLKIENGQIENKQIENLRTEKCTSSLLLPLRSDPLSTAADRHQVGRVAKARPGGNKLNLMTQIIWNWYLYFVF